MNKWSDHFDNDREAGGAPVKTAYSIIGMAMPTNPERVMLMGGRLLRGEGPMQEDITDTLECMNGNAFVERLGYGLDEIGLTEHGGTAPIRVYMAPGDDGGFIILA
jgi:hypothetical protein